MILHWVSFNPMLSYADTSFSKCRLKRIQNTTCKTVITLSLPLFKAPTGKVNLSSVSSRMFALLLELNMHAVSPLINLCRIARRKNKQTYFPYDVPKKTLLSQTLAAKALRKKKEVSSTVVYLDSYINLITFSSIDRKVHASLMASSQEMPSPKNRVFTTAS